MKCVLTDEEAMYINHVLTSEYIKSYCPRTSTHEFTLPDGTVVDTLKALSNFQCSVPRKIGEQLVKITHDRLTGNYNSIVGAFADVIDKISKG